MSIKNKYLVLCITMILILAGCSKDPDKNIYPVPNPDPDLRNQGYLAGDFHQHTTFTDGSWSFGHVMGKNLQYGLSWWVNSEHGGAYNRNGAMSGIDLGNTVTWDNIPDLEPEGSPPYGFLWRWQSIKDFSFAEILKYRNLFTGKIIIQGFEWNVPGYEHADVAIISHQFDNIPHARDIAEFEYKFDNNDTDTTGGKSQGWIKSLLSGHHKTIEAVKWMQDHHAGYGWIIPGHPERQKLYTISSFRDMNNAGPDVCFGFEGMPGHQRYSYRGMYTSGNGVYGFSTYGGAGWMVARIGGVWDAMLSEGRRWWAFANSDFHDLSLDFYPGEYQKNFIYVSDKSKPETLVKGMQTGNCYFVTGDLIDSLYFFVRNTTIGGTCEIISDSVVIYVRVHDPDGLNNNIYSAYNNPKLDHIDIIRGVVNEKILPGTADYALDYVNTTGVIARFDSIGGIAGTKNITSVKWISLSNGWKEMKYTVKNITGDTYFRLRGTNHGLNVNNETDSDGNPVSDDLMYPNTPQKAFADLWFYSNPIFVKVKM